MFGKLRQFIKKGDTIHLTKDELDMGRKSLSAYMTEHPAAPRTDAVVRNTEDIRHIWQRPLFLTQRPMFATIATIVILALSGGTAAAAEGSVPGSSLYPIKVYVNEQVRAALAVSPQAKVNWEARRAERRLEEVTQLAADNKLSASTSLQLGEQFKRHAERVQERIERMEEKGNVENAAWVKHRFQASLKAHQAILERFTTPPSPTTSTTSTVPATTTLVTTTPEVHLRPLLIELKLKLKEEKREEKREQKDERKEDRREEKVEKVAEHALKSALHKINTVSILIGRVKEKFGIDAMVRAQAKLDRAQRVYADGKAAFDAKTYGKAIELFKEVYTLAQEAHLLLNVERRHAIKPIPLPLPPATTTPATSTDDGDEDDEDEDTNTSTTVHSQTTSSVNNDADDEDEKEKDRRGRGPFKFNQRLEGRVKADIKL